MRALAAAPPTTSTHFTSPDGAEVRSRHHLPWSLEEVAALLDGVEQCGGGHWTSITKLELPLLQRRKPMDLKDKWRNLLATAFLPLAERKGTPLPDNLHQRLLKLSKTTVNQPKK